MNYIPYKVNLSGVIPAIFASAILMFPANCFTGEQNKYLVMIADYLNPSSYTLIYLCFICSFLCIFLCINYI